MKLVAVRVCLALFFWCLPFHGDGVVPTARELPELQAVVDATPSIPDWTKFFEPVGDFGRCLRVAAPCTGIHGCGFALQSMAISTHTNNIYDLDDRYRLALQSHLREMGMRLLDITMNLGKTSGNLLGVDLTELQQADVLVCGPPCPPWAGNGSKKSLRDPRAKVFFAILEWVWYLATYGGLMIAIIENVPGIKNSIDGREPALHKFIRILQEYVPFFSWATDTLHLVAGELGTL